MGSVVRCLCLVWVCIHHATQVNVALNMNASTTSGIYNTWNPPGAVDGDHVTLYSSSSCFISATSPSDWTVDLGQQYQLYNITVYLIKGLNVALNKNTSTTSGIYISGPVSDGKVWYPAGAVDGDHEKLNSWTSCFQSRRAPADWTVDLGQVYQLYNVSVYIRRNWLFRTADSATYVDNDPSRVCYTFPSTISDNPTRLTCNETARYVTIRNPGTDQYSDSLDICEVEIYACTGGYRGVDCEVDCHCDECDRWTGICNSTCTPGWEGQRCDRACNGTYGPSCNNSCDARQCSNSSSSCDPVNGTCDSGCLAGWTGHDCVTECLSSTYGLNCSQNCKNRHCMENSICDHVAGSCDQSCEPGWKSTDCTTECVKGEEFGPNCVGSCNARHCLNKSSCDPTTGLCDFGCEAGWEGSQCLQALQVPDVAATESTTTDVGTIALSTTVAVLVVIIAVIIAVFLIRMKLKERSSDSRSTDVNRPASGPSPTTDHIYTDITPSNADTSTKPADYETLELTEDNHYTGLKEPNLYVNS